MMTQFARAGPAILLAILALALSTLYLSHPNPILLNSDTLLPADFAWDVLHRGGAWLQFQQARVPSFVPDLLVFVLVQAAGHSWRIAYAVFLVVLLLTLLSTGAVITGRVAQTSFGRATVAFALVAVPIMVLAIPDGILADWQGYRVLLRTLLPYCFTAIPVSHGGSFVLSLIGAVLAARWLDRPSGQRLLVFTALSWVATLSDIGYVLTLLTPLSVAVAAGWHVGSVSRRDATMLLAAGWLAGVLGVVPMALISHEGLQIPLRAAIVATAAPLCILAVAQPGLHHWLRRYIVPIGGAVALATLLVLMWAVQWLLQPTSPALLAKVARFPTLGSPGFFASSSAQGLRLSIVALAAVTALLVAAAIRRDGWRGFLTRFWGLFAITAMLDSLAILVVLYRDTGSARYGAALFWWPVILLAVRLARFLERQRGMTVGGWVGALATLAFALSRPGAPALFFGYRPELEACLKEAELNAGVGDYWIARTVTMESDGALQIEPIARDGTAQHWGNDLFWYSHARGDPSRAPNFQFIVMKRLDPDAIAALYGKPDRVLQCGSQMVWVYPKGLGAILERTLPGRLQR